MWVNRAARLSAIGAGCSVVVFDGGLAAGKPCTSTEHPSAVCGPRRVPPPMKITDPYSADDRPPRPFRPRYDNPYLPMVPGTRHDLRGLIRPRACNRRRTEVTPRQNQRYDHGRPRPWAVPRHRQALTPRWSKDTLDWVCPGIRDGKCLVFSGEATKKLADGTAEHERIVRKGGR